MPKKAVSSVGWLDQVESIAYGSYAAVEASTPDGDGGEFTGWGSDAIGAGVEGNGTTGVESTAIGKGVGAVTGLVLTPDWGTPLGALCGGDG